jgi:acetyl esterase/lipase
MAIWPALANFHRRRRGAVAREDVPYADDDDRKHRVDVYAPHGADDPPLALFVHGGYWAAQDRRLLRPVLGLYSNVGLALAARGVAVAVAGYRQHPRVRSGDESLADLARAVAWLASRSQRPRVTLIGHSAGAHLAWLLALAPAHLRAAGVDPACVRGVVGLAGLYDLPGTTATLRPRHAAVVRALFGDDLRSRSPLHRVHAGAPPALLLAAARDDASLLAGHAAMAAALRAAGVACDEATLPGRGHMGLVIEMGLERDEVSDRVAAFVTGRSSAA